MARFPSGTAFTAIVKNTFVEVAPAFQKPALRRQRSDGELLKASGCNMLQLSTPWSPQTQYEKKLAEEDDGYMSASTNDDCSDSWSSSDRSESTFDDVASCGDSSAVEGFQFGLPVGCVTVMLRRVPHKYTQKALMHEISKEGFHGTFDCFYLPLESRCNRSRGFAFINFKSSCSAQEFFERFHGQTLEQSSFGIPLEVVPAEVQGLNAMMAHFDAQAKAHEGQRRARGQPYFAKKAQKATGQSK